MGQLLHRLFAPGPDAFDLLLQGRVFHPPGSFELGKDNLHPGRLIPAGSGCLDKGLQAPPGGLEAVPVGLFQPRLFLGQVTGPGHLVRPIGGGLAGLLQEQAAPGGLSHIGHRRQVQGFPLAGQPGQGVGVALNFSIDIQGDLQQAAVIPPFGEHIQQPGKGPCGVDLLIPCLQHLV